MIGSLEDITERKINEEQLKQLNLQLNKRMEELAVSNAELEQFAYIASHDLQEPLRMITRFLSEIQRKYNDKLDDKGKEYIHYAVDGSHRMRNLILDLLEYSRV
ncbi:sensor histidine kinase, partial [Flavobacterium lindanitolerans]